MKLHVLKFGGSSVATPQRIRNSVAIVQRQLAQSKVAVVVSALGGVTDELIAIMDKACGNDPQWSARFDHLRKRHYDSAQDLTTGADTADLVRDLNELFEEFLGVLQIIRVAGKISAKQRDHVLSFGERLSCRIFAAALREDGVKAKSYESHHFVRTNNRFGDADVDNKTTIELVQKLLGPANGTVPVITGFIGATVDNEITTLGRSGSDYTAGLMGEALGADVVTCVVMPSPHSSSETQDDAHAIAANLGCESIEIGIEPVMKAYEAALAGPFEGTAPDVAEENLQARIRGNMVMALSNKFGWVPLSTGNKSEMSVG